MSDNPISDNATHSSRAEDQRHISSEVAKHAGSNSQTASKLKGFLGLLKPTFAQWSKHKVPRMAAALAYYTIFSLAPTLFIAVAVAGIVFGEQAAQGQIVEKIQTFVGHGTAAAVQNMIASAHQPSHQLIGTVVGLLVLALGATTVFVELRDGLNEIWGVDTTKQSGVWSMILSRVFSFVMVVCIGLLLLASLLLSAAIGAAAKYLSGALPIPDVALRAADLVFSVFFMTLLFALIYKILPEAKIPWNDVWVGAAMTSILFTIGKFLIGWYVGRSITSSSYGAAASLIILIAFIYYAAQLLYFGAEFTNVYARERGSRNKAPTEINRARRTSPAPAHS